MTPEERIAQLAAERGGVATIPRAPRLAPDRPKTDGPQLERTRPNGFGIVLPASWRKIHDNWENRDQRARLAHLELFLAAGVIARYLGPNWSRHTPAREGRDSIEIVHRDGYGFRLSRCWRDPRRLEASPIDTYTRGEPSSITVSATRPLGAIARDIENRLIDQGLAEAYRQHIECQRQNREDTRRRFANIAAVAKAWGGRIREKRYTRSDAYPEATIPGGIARCYYDNRIQFDLTVTPEQAVRLGTRH